MFLKDFTAVEYLPSHHIELKEEAGQEEGTEYPEDEEKDAADDEADAVAGTGTISTGRRTSKDGVMVLGLV